MELIPVFAQRAGEVARAFSFTGATAPAASDMDQADAEVYARVAALEDKLAGTDVDLADLAIKATSGKAADVKALRESIMVRQVVNTPAYLQAIRAAAKQVRKDLDRKEWSQAALIKSMLPVARKHMARVSTQAVESLKDLPERIQAEIIADRQLATRVARELDPATATGNQVETAQTCEWAWGIIDQTGNGYYETQALAIHRGRVTSLEEEARERRTVEREKKLAASPNLPVNAVRPAQDKDQDAPATPRHGEFDSHMARAVWADTQAMEAMAAGIFSLEAIVLNGRGSINGLVDPYGKDAEELAARLEAYDAVRGWLQTQAYRKDGKRRHPGYYSGWGGQPLYRQAGYSTPEDALAAYRAR